jgi:hypothetical protein
MTGRCRSRMLRRNSAWPGGSPFRFAPLGTHCVGLEDGRKRCGLLSSTPRSGGGGGVAKRRRRGGRRRPERGGGACLVVDRIAGMDGEAWIPDTSSFAALGRRSGMTKAGVRTPCESGGSLGAGGHTRVIPDTNRAERGASVRNPFRDAGGCQAPSCRRLGIDSGSGRLRCAAAPPPTVWGWRTDGSAAASCPPPHEVGAEVASRSDDGGGTAATGGRRRARPRLHSCPPRPRKTANIAITTIRIRRPDRFRLPHQVTSRHRPPLPDVTGDREHGIRGWRFLSLTKWGRGGTRSVTVRGLPPCDARLHGPGCSNPCCNLVRPMFQCLLQQESPP